MAWDGCSGPLYQDAILAIKELSRLQQSAFFGMLGCAAAQIDQTENRLYRLSDLEKWTKCRVWNERID